MLTDDALQLHLQALERELHDPATWRVDGRLAALLHDDFVEFGSSGAVYAKPDVLASPPPAGQAIQSDGFALERLAPDVALLTYRSARALSGAHSRALRSSIWRRNGDDWQLVFHQGTPLTSPSPP